MISVAEAQSLCLALATPMATEEVALADANGRVMVVPAATTRAQPPFRSA
ncbi:MAG: molybdopterin molybdenumtransferase MoeA, partial [Marivivens sp.]|nr:molybdopterin molybdenumtransferase MoeA [Marivivens sp.]